MTLTRERRKYTDEELYLIEEMVGSYSFNHIANKLGRTPKAIEVQLARMGLLNTKLVSGQISAKELGNALGANYKVLMRWREQFNLPLKGRNLRHGVNKAMTWYIRPEKFWKWADKYREEVNWTRYIPESLPPEPPWLFEIVERQKSTALRKRKLPWTPEDDELAWSLYYKGVTQVEIAKRLYRSRNSVEKRLKRLREVRLK
jgi:Mn-dependent DtxR family transcriptional regulator